MKAILLATLVMSFALEAGAWGRRGHALINQTAAQLVFDRGVEGGAMLKDRAFDLGYYANVPDLIWKKPETYKQESSEHFMDLEIFQRGVKTMSLDKAFAMDRSEFNRTFPEVEERAGRAFWRIRELMTRLDGIATELKKSDLQKDRRLELQASWLSVAGVMGHYVGDLSQPLHVTENYDGQMTEQKGIHSFFEDAVVDEFQPGEIEHAVYAKARTLKHELAGKNVQTVLQQLTTESHKSLADVLKIDKKIGRKDKLRARGAYRQILIDRMATGSVFLAELWSRSLGWKYDSEKFFNFTPHPEFIVPGSDRAIDSAKSEKK